MAGSAGPKKKPSIDTLIFTLVGLSILVVGAGVSLILFSDQLAEEGVFGEGEMEIIDFETLTLSPGPDHYLACAEGYCRQAQPDEVTDEFQVPITELRNRLTRFIDSQQRVEVKSLDLLNLQFVLLVYSGIEPFPDVVTIKLYDLGAPRSGISILSQTLKGNDKTNRNRQRVQRWLEVLKRP